MSAASAPLIELQNVTVAFGSDVILKDISLTVQKEEVIFVIGPSGKGKSTLLKTIAGLISPTAGKVLIEGQQWSEMRGATKAQLLRRFGMLFQKNALFDSMSCGENIAFPMRETTDTSEPEIDKTVEMFLENVGIPHAKNLFPDEISGGMQKRLGIARALALAPEIILYDDPTAGLDPITSRKIIDLIAEFQKKSRSTVMAITNDMNRAYQMAQRILMVVDQTVLEAGGPAAILENRDPRVHGFIRGEM